MGDVVSFLFIPVALALMLPFLVVMGLPLLVIAWIWWRLTSARIGLPTRVIVAAFICALGIAPYIYAHGAVPIYIVILSGEPFSLNFAISFAITFALLLALFTFKVRKHREAAS